jgi:hypothetical protein
LLFKGVYEESIGTNLFFEDGKLTGKTTKKIVFHRIVVEEKQKTSEENL